MAEIKIKTPDGNNHVSLTTANASGDATVTLPKTSIDFSSAGSDGQFLKTDGAGTLSFATVAVGGATGTDYNDSVKTRWGTNNDLEMYHDNSNSYIKHANNGSLEIDATSSGHIILKPDGEVQVGNSKNLKIDNGNLVIGTAGKGIDFSATTNESGSSASMDSELLDDYEEGEWTPDLTFSTSSTGISYNYRGGRYIKVGNLVHCSAYIFLSSKGSGSGYAEVSLPIQPMNAAPSVTHAQGGFCTESGGWADNKTMVIFRVRGDASKAYVQCNTSSTNHHAYAEIADFTDSTKMIMTFIYRST